MILLLVRKSLLQILPSTYLSVTCDKYTSLECIPRGWIDYTPWFDIGSVICKKYSILSPIHWKRNRWKRRLLVLRSTCCEDTIELLLNIYLHSHFITINSLPGSYLQANPQRAACHSKHTTCFYLNQSI